MGDHQAFEHGLYRREDEHDSCGIGFVANIRGQASHDIVHRGLEVLERMEHRGAESADNSSGDGAGVLVQIPHAFYAAILKGSDWKAAKALPEAGNYGTGLLFLPSVKKDAARILALLEEVAAIENLSLIAQRSVPVTQTFCGEIAARSMPSIVQVFFAQDGDDALPLELRLWVFRKKFEKAVRASDINGKDDVHFPSLSSKTIVYKGMLSSSQLRGFFPDLSDERFESAVALVHSRFSTNTFPAWSLAQPFRMIAHNGEINTVKGNRFWMKAREALLSHPDLGTELAAILPVIEPGKSDSASFDNALELLVRSGRSLPQALMMLIPESWNDKNPISDQLKRFYEYQACNMEPWDGPASIVFCDGRFVGGTLDRNGLRPSRWTLIKYGLLVMASETGVQDIDAVDVAAKGRLQPGKLLLVDMKEGRIIPDTEVKEAVCRAKPYERWVQENVKSLDALPEGNDELPFDAADRRSLDFVERAFGYTREDRDTLLSVMADSAQEPTNSMGTDTPVAVLSQKSQSVFNYFKQVFAQVTNPAIDSIREELVMTLTSFVGRHGNILEEGPANCRLLKVLNPILSPGYWDRLVSKPHDDQKLVQLDASFYMGKADSSTASPAGADRAGGKGDLAAAIERLCSEAVQAVRDGATILVLSDRAVAKADAGRCAIPALLATAAVHQALGREGLRMLASIVCDSGEPREIMHMALLFGYGADLVHPWGAFAVIRDLRPETAHAAFKNFVKGLNKAMLKVMSKMGTSTLRSYRGAGIFEAIGLGDEIMTLCFPATASRLGGVGFDAIEKDYRAWWQDAYNAAEAAVENDPVRALLPSIGQYRWRKGGEQHAWNPETIHLLQWATREGDWRKFKEFTAKADELNRRPHVIRGLFDLAKAGDSISIDEVEPVEAIMQRFTTGAMSFGSISKEAHECIAIAMNSIHGRSNSGEGGEETERFTPRADGSWARSAIKQVASGRFGVTSTYLANAMEIQIKVAQGAKPGEGGQLPGHKVDALIAKTRYSTAGVTLISPPPHHDIYSIEDLAELIFDLKNANPKARISVKLVSETGVGTVAAGVAKAHADNITISGYDGGTGASPQSSIRHAGLPWELGLRETHQTLVLNGLRDRIKLMTDGQLKTGRDIVLAALLGAEEFGFGTSTLIVLGCVMMRKCHENTCPMGVATQDPDLRKKFAGKSAFLVNFFRFLAQETRELMAELGFRTFNEMVGKSECLVPRILPDTKAGSLDLSRLLVKGEPAYGEGHKEYCNRTQLHHIEEVLDRELISRCLPAIEAKKPASFALDIHNTDRSVGTMLSYEVSTRLGEGGLPDNFVTVDFAGSAGQSFGAFLAPGITFRLSGDANDYLGKGLSGGRIVVAPPAGSDFKTNENIIVGNTVLYGATSGELFAAGVAGERFCVRNSGATAVS